MLILMWVACFIILALNYCEAKEPIIRHRRQAVIHLDILPESNNSVHRGLHYRKSKKKKSKKRKAGKGRTRCDTGDYWGDLLLCGDGDFSFSMPTVVIAPSPSFLPPNSAISPLPAPSPSFNNPLTFAPFPTIPIALPDPTIPSSECQLESRSDVIIQQIEEIVPDVVDRPAEPVGRALGWLLMQDPSQLDPCVVNSDTLTQRYLATLFWYSTGGMEWTRGNDWLTGASECEWLGIQCSGDGAIQRLSLPANNLRGTIPSEMSLLTMLQSVELYRNGLSGSIPDLARFPNLQVVDLEENLLTGQAFGSLPPSLSIYRVSLNSLSGSIPSEIPTTLRELWAAGNRLSGSIPSTLGSASLLESLILFDSRLSGTLPTELGGLQELSRLQLYMNQLSGTIPEELYQLSSVTELRLERNNLEGTLSPSVGRLQNLMDVRLGENRFNGSIPHELWSLTNLNVVLANATSFVGTIPDTFAALTNLVFLDLSNNMIMGTIPPSIFTNGIQFLYLAENSLTGAIPSTFVDAPALRDLYIFGNLLTGTVPSLDVADDDLSTLTEFRLERNMITGSMPDSICALRGDTALSILFADCGGAIPRIQCDCCNGCSTR